jgi:hypothetical protein
MVLLVLHHDREGHSETSQGHTNILTYGCAVLRCEVELYRKLPHAIDVAV